ncbi:UNKNOWN [Stylonychia lemnae]|uniref:Transmembrane protein n=1 Tax=Stylonychia lemnae TaxID=5949 RepID=A0A077ZTD9_STYLE|nr:UNKNOWN [Stylonychia lemnae]|eukprot:CDW71726.1 UNKNOWN [Stylonychia lemnae]
MKAMNSAQQVQMINGLGLCLCSTRKTKLISLPLIAIFAGTVMFSGTIFYSKMYKDYRFNKLVPYGGGASMVGVKKQLMQQAQLNNLALLRNHTIRQMKDVQSPDKDPTSKMLLNQFINNGLNQQRQSFQIQVSNLYKPPQGSQQLQQQQSSSQDAFKLMKSEQRKTAKFKSEIEQPKNLKYDTSQSKQRSQSNVPSTEGTPSNVNQKKNFKLEPLNLQKKPTKIYSASEIQRQIKIIIDSANADIKDIQISKTTGMLYGDYKEKLIDQMKKNLVVMGKLEKLSKNPFLQNDFLYNRLMKSTINYYQRAMHKEQYLLKDKIDWIESQYFHWLTKLIKVLQYFQTSDLVPMKQEVANIFNWFQNFTKYLEGLKLLEYPTFFKRTRRKSTELLDLDKMSNSGMTHKKDRSRMSSSDQQSNVGKDNELEKLGIKSTPNNAKNQQQIKVIGDLSREVDIDKVKIDVNLKQKKPSNKMQTDQVPLTPIIGLTSQKTFTNMEIHNQMNHAYRMLPKMPKRDTSVAHIKTKRQTYNETDDDLILPNFRNRQDSQPLLSNHSSYIGASDTDSVENNSVSSSSNNTDKIYKKPEDLRKKYLIEAPLSFKMNAPPKIVDLTSDFFEKDTEQIMTPPLQNKASTQSPRKAGNFFSQTAPAPMVKRQRMIINNPKQNAAMVELGKKKIGNLKNFYGKMISAALMREFEVMFAPLDENTENQEYSAMDKSGPQSIAQQVMNQTQGVMPPGLLHDDVLNQLRSPDQESQMGQKNGMFEFKASGMSMVRRTAQDDYRYSQLNEIQNLKGLLVKKGINMDFKVLQRAILMPEDQVFDSSDRVYPKPYDGLMVNPFPKKAGASKKKKKKKKILRTQFSMDPKE